MNLKKEVAAVAAWMERKAAEKIAQGRKQNGLIPRLSFIFQEGDAPSERYVAQKVKACARVGIDSVRAPYRLNEENPEDHWPLLWEVIDAAQFCDGVIIQDPLPAAINRREVRFEVAEHLKPTQDVDGAYTRGRFMPCTALGVFFLLRFLHGENLAGRTAVIFGSGVGLSIAEMLSRQLGMTVTVLNSKSTDGAARIAFRIADVVVSAMGEDFPDFLPNFEKTFIDVGFRVVDGKIQGDLSGYPHLENSIYTPVPGGVGKLTVAALMLNAAYGYSPTELASHMAEEIDSEL